MVSTAISSALDAGVTAPDAPNLIFVSGLAVVSQEGGGKSTGRPSELDPFFRFPFAEDGVEETTDKAVAAADTIENGDVAGFNNLPFAFNVGDSAPEMVVGINDLTEGGGESSSVGISSFHAFDHLFEAVDFAFDILTAGFGSFDLQAELEVFFVTDKHVGERSDFSEDSAEFFFAALPEGGAVVQVKADLAAVFLGGAGDFQTEFAGVGRQRGDQTGKVDDLEDVWVKLPSGYKYWDGLRFSIEANGPTRSVTLNGAITRGLAPLPDVAEPEQGDSYTWNGTEWVVSVNYENADNISY